MQKRLAAGVLLADEEIHDLVRLYKLKAPAFEAQCLQRQAEVQVAKVTSLEHFRKAPAKSNVKDAVAPETASIRLFYTRKFLVAQAEKVALKGTTAPEVRAALLELKALFETRLKALAPTSRTPSDAPPPEGLSEAQVAQVLAVVDPQSPENPWKNDFVRKRNQLIVQTLHALGIRGGELLKLKTSDIKPANSSVWVTRSPDDPTDRRLRQPQAKTRARELGLSPVLVGHLLAFITTERRQIPLARKHPFIFIAEDGNPRITPWSFRSGVTDIYLDFEALSAQLSPSLLLSYKLVQIWHCENRSARTVNTLHHRFCEFIAQACQPAGPLSCIEASALAFYRVNEVNQGWDLVAPMLKRWHAQGYAGLTPDAHDFLRKTKNHKRKSRASPVETLCPHYGPLSSMERDAFDAAYNQAFGDGQLTDEEYILLTLLRIFGSRPSQFALMKVKDVHRAEKAPGQVDYVLQIPSVKKGVLSRAQFKVRVLTDDFGQFLHGYALKVAEQLRDQFEDPREAPLFPATGSRVEDSPGFKYHRTGGYVSRFIADCEKKVSCRSERTGEQMNVTAVRFRRTLGTTLAEEGHPAAVIAEALDHASTQHVKCYTGITGVLNERINKAMAMHLAPLAQAFCGVVVNRNEVDQELPTVRDIRVKGTFEPVGKCGKFGFCKSAAPVACYTCASFRPFKDAPHEALLDFMLAERERFLAASGQTLAATEDRTIVAIAEVVKLCREESSRG